jgi:hypothetical protein
MVSAYTPLVIAGPYWRPGGVVAPKNHVRNLAALVVLEVREVPVARSDAGSAGRKGRAYVVLVCLKKIK